MSTVCEFPVLAQQVLVTAARSSRRPVVGVDGPGGAGSTFTEHLARHLPGTTVVHVDDFYRPTTQRPRHGTGIADNIDLDRLAEQVLRPAASGSATRYQRYDWNTDSLAEWIDVPALEPVVIEGVYSVQKTLRDHYSYRVFCTTDREERLHRGIARDGEAARSTWVDEWMPAEDYYLEREDPAAAAELVVDGSTTTSTAGVSFLVVRS